MLPFATLCYLLFTLAVLFLVGCQQKLTYVPIAPVSTPAVPETVPVKEQVRIMGSVLAGTRYLRERCHQIDIPGEPRLREALLVNERDIKTQEYQQISTETERHYQFLITPLLSNSIHDDAWQFYRNLSASQKCQALNIVLSGFIDGVKHQDAGTTTQ